MTLSPEPGDDYWEGYQLPQHEMVYPITYLNEWKNLFQCKCIGCPWASKTLMFPKRQIIKRSHLDPVAICEREFAHHVRCEDILDRLQDQMKLHPLPENHVFSLIFNNSRENHYEVTCSCGYLSEPRLVSEKHITRDIVRLRKFTRAHIFNSTHDNDKDNDNVQHG